MAHYGSRSPKREKMFANNKAVARFCRGKLTKVQKASMKLDVKTTKRTKGGGYQGTSELKGTQRLVFSGR